MDAFARETIHILGFVEPCLILNTHHSIPLRNSGVERRVAQTDVCLFDLRSTILVVLQNRIQRVYPKPQVIAGAIAAHKHNDENGSLNHFFPLTQQLFHASLWLALDPSSI
jgi:hypothetical protein